MSFFAALDDTQRAELKDFVSEAIQSAFLLTGIVAPSSNQPVSDWDRHQPKPFTNTPIPDVVLPDSFDWLPKTRQEWAARGGVWDKALQGGPRTEPRTQERKHYKEEFEALYRTGLLGVEISVNKLDPTRKRRAFKILHELFGVGREYIEDDIKAKHDKWQKQQRAHELVRLRREVPVKRMAVGPDRLSVPVPVVPRPNQTEPLRVSSQQPNQRMAPAGRSPSTSSPITSNASLSFVSSLSSVHVQSPSSSASAEASSARSNSSPSSEYERALDPTGRWVHLLRNGHLCGGGKCIAVGPGTSGRMTLPPDAMLLNDTWVEQKCIRDLDGVKVEIATTGEIVAFADVNRESILAPTSMFRIKELLPTSLRSAAETAEVTPFAKS